MNWTEPKPPTEGESYYDHVKCQTPLGEFKVEWKSWKENPSYDLQLGDKWISCEYSLEDIKEEAEIYLINIRNNLNDFLAEKE